MLDRLKSKARVLSSFVCVTALVFVVFSGEARERTNRGSPVENNQLFSVGDSQALFHTEPEADKIVLNVLVISDGDAEEMLRFRTTLVDGQRYSVVVRPNDRSEDLPGDRFDFVRVGDKVIAMGNPAAEQPRMMQAGVSL